MIQIGFIGAMAVMLPIHMAGTSQIETALDRAIADANRDGIKVNAGVDHKFAPTGYGWNDGGLDFQAWLKRQGLELCKSDHSGHWWTVVRTADVINRDKSGTAIGAHNKFSYPNLQ